MRKLFTIIVLSLLCALPARAQFTAQVWFVACDTNGNLLSPVTFFSANSVAQLSGGSFTGGVNFLSPTGLSARFISGISTQGQSGVTTQLPPFVIRPEPGVAGGSYNHYQGDLKIGGQLAPSPQGAEGASDVYILPNYDSSSNNHGSVIIQWGQYHGNAWGLTNFPGFLLRSTNAAILATNTVGNLATNGAFTEKGYWLEVGANIDTSTARVVYPPNANSYIEYTNAMGIGAGRPYKVTWTQEVIGNNDILDMSLGGETQRMTDIVSGIHTMIFARTVSREALRLRVFTASPPTNFVYIDDVEVGTYQDGHITAGGDVRGRDLYGANRILLKGESITNLFLHWTTNIPIASTSAVIEAFSYAADIPNTGFVFTITNDFFGNGTNHVRVPFEYF